MTLLSIKLTVLTSILWHHWLKNYHEKFTLVLIIFVIFLGCFFLFNLFRFGFLYSLFGFFILLNIVFSLFIIFVLLLRPLLLARSLFASFGLKKVLTLWERVHSFSLELNLGKIFFRWNSISTFNEKHMRYKKHY